MKKAKILVVEDEEAILEIISTNLYNNKFTPIRSLSAEDAERQIKNVIPDLIILDWMLPGMNGIEFLKRLKLNNITKKIPVIMLTAKDEEENKIRGLDLGADDYLSKPFSSKELIARIRAVIRRNSDESNIEIIIGKLSINIDNHITKFNDIEFKLGPTEFKLLYFFMANQERVLTRESLVDKIWSNESEIDIRTIDVHVKRLRSQLLKLGIKNSVDTIRGSGYKLASENYFE